MHMTHSVDFSWPGRRSTATVWTSRSSVAVSAACRRSWTCRRTAACRAARRWRWRDRAAAAGWQLIAYCWWVTPRDYAATSSIYARTTDDMTRDTIWMVKLWKHTNSRLNKIKEILRHSVSSGQGQLINSINSAICTTAFLTQRLIIVSKSRKIEYHLILMKASERGRNVKGF